MGIEKQGSKSGNYVGGFLQLFDWNAKSRKKLFSSKSDLPEKSKQKKWFDGNLPMTRLQMLDEDDVAARSSIKGSSDYSRASSVTDEDFCVTRAPGVVARLMGLDSLPKSNNLEPNSTPFDSRSLPGSYYQSRNLEYHQDPQIMMHSTSLRNDMEPKHQKVIHRPIEKFQTEILPPKSAKSIPITHHKLLSPIKSANSIPPKDAAHIMEAAARIIEPGPQASKKTKLPLAGSSSAPLKVKDLKEKVQAAQKPLKDSEGSRRLSESSAVKHLKGHSMNKSWNGSVDATSTRSSPHSGESSASVKSKGKSISLALQAKANVQKREGLNLNSSRTFVSQKETSEVSANKPFTSQSMAQKSKLKKPLTQNSSSVLRQNNQKQNCTIDREKLPSKSNLQDGKAISGDSSSAKRNSSKLVTSSKVSPGKLGSEVKDDKKQVLLSSSERVTRRKRSIDGNYHSQKNRNAHNIRKDKNGKLIQSSAIMDTQGSLDQDSERIGTDVISFTFTAPMTRSGPGSGRYTEAGENCKIFTEDSRSKRLLLNSDDMGATKFTFPVHNDKGGDTLSKLLEQKLKELNDKVEFSQQNSGSVLHGTENKVDDGNEADNLDGHPGSSSYRLRDPRGFRCQGLVVETGIHGRNISEERKLLDCRLPSPVSVLEHSSSFGESCNSLDTADSNSTGGGKQYPSNQFNDMLSRCSTNTSLPLEGDAELSDSASSTSVGMVAKGRETTLTYGKPRAWEVEYVKQMLCNIEPMFKEYASGKASKIINPRLFDQLESQKAYFNGCGLVPRINRRLLFDCARECLDLRCRQYVGGGYESWAKGLCIVKQNDKLAEDVYKDISRWSAMGDFMVDELVDYNMSSQYGRWLDYDIEAFELGVQIESRILNSLIDEVVADMLVL